MDGHESAEVAERLGPYRLVTRIGEGGMGAVYLGLDPDRRTVAVKVLHPHVAADKVSRARLAREVETMRRVTSPHVAEVLDADLHGHRPYIVTRYVQGRTLREVVDHDGPLSGTPLARVARGLADALAAIHAAGVVHRDVKPSNVVLVDGEPVIIDFGIAQAVDASQLTQTGMFVGTPAYLAPEVLEGGASASSSDVHAWAAVVAFAATGRSPFGSGSHEYVFANIAQGRADLAGIPEPFLALVRAGFARDPSQRPPATWLRDRADSLLEGGHAVAPVPHNHSRTRAYTGQGGPGAGPYTHHVAPPVAPYAGQATPRTENGSAPATRPYTMYGPSHAPAGQAPYPPPHGPQPYDRQPARTPPPPAAHPRPTWSRSLVGILGVVAIAGLVGIAPSIGVIAVAVLVTALRTSDGIATGLSARRSRRGPRDVDPLLSAAGLPWHATWAAVRTCVHLLLPLLSGATVVAVLQVGGGVLPTSVLLGGCVFVLLTFFGPGAGKPRQRAAGILASALRGRTPHIVVASVAVLAILLELSAIESRLLVWWPFEAFAERVRGWL